MSDPTQSSSSTPSSSSTTKDNDNGQSSSSSSSSGLNPRPRNMVEFHATMSKFWDRKLSKESIEELKTPRPTDVINATFQKCGTTWLQNIFHQLRSRGDLNFEEVSCVVPWIETAKMMKQDLNAEQKWHPRGYKSHLRYNQAPKGCKYMVILRDPTDALLSMYHYFTESFAEPGCISMDEFSEDWFNGKLGNYAAHFVSWWNQRDNPQVLLLPYEFMVQQDNFQLCLDLIAKFCEIELDDELRKIVTEYSSVQFMKKHMDLFDEGPFRRAVYEACKIPPRAEGAVGKVRIAKAGGGKEQLPTHIQERVQQMWTDKIKNDPSVSGSGLEKCESYKDAQILLAEKVKQDHKKLIENKK